MAEYIKREAALRKMQKFAVDAWTMRIKASAEIIWNEAQDVIRSVPAADVQPVKHGRWIEDVVYYGEDGSPCYAAFCSECNTPEPMERDYCPNCGARMDGDA